MQRALVSLVIILLAMFVFWQGESLPSSPVGNERIPITIGGKTFRMEVVTTRKGYTQGLSGRKALEENEGMLFVFKNAGYYPIWMKGMRFPIDIIWVDGEFRIVDIKEHVLPESFPKAFYPSKPARFVLELNAGEVKKNNMSIGSHISGLAN